MKKQKIIFFCIGFLCSLAVSALELHGQLEAVNSVEGAMVILIETDEIIMIEQDGKFSFTSLNPGTYTMMVSHPDYVSQTKEINLSEDMEIVIRLEPHVVEMPEIEVSAEKNEKSSNDVANRDREEIESLPTANDPIQAIKNNPGVVMITPTTDPGNRFSSINTAAGLLDPQAPNLSMYGSENDMNNFYFGQSRLTTVYHQLTGRTLFPPATLDSVTSVPGVAPVNYWPGIGGIVVMNPRSEHPEQADLDVYASVTDLGVFYISKKDVDFPFYISLRHSIINYTLVPLMHLIYQNTPDYDDRQEVVTGLHAGDILFNMQHKNSLGEFTFNSFAYYDLVHTKIDSKSEVEGIITNTLTLNIDLLPYAFGSRFDWVSYPAENIKNKLSLLGGMDNRFVEAGYDSWSAIAEITSGLKENSYITTGNIEAHNTTSIGMSQESVFDIGLAIRYSNVAAEIKRSTIGLDFLGETNVTIAPENILALNNYAMYKYNSDTTEAALGAGLIYLPLTNYIMSRFRGDLQLKAGSLTSNYHLGVSPGIYNESKYGIRKLNEKYYDLSKSTMEELPLMAFLSTDQTYDFNENHQLSLHPYGGFYWNLDGLEYSTGYNKRDELTSDLIHQFQDADWIIAAGADLRYLYTNNDLGIEFETTYSYILNRSKLVDEEWLITHNDLPALLRTSFRHKPFEDFKWAINGSIASGFPFTPEYVPADAAAESYITERGTFNSARDIMPQFSLDVMFTWDWRDEKNKGLLFSINSCNTLFFINYVLMGLNKSTPGATTANIEDRNYYNYPNFQQLFKLDLYWQYTF